MTSENELDIIKPIDTNENPQEIINEIPSNQDQPAIEEPIIPKNEDEPIHTEKPKRPGRKKREISVSNDIKTDSLNNDNAVDTQPLFEQPIIVEGKRSRKPTSRLELSDLETPKKELSIPQGHGKPLGEIEYINYQINNASTDALSRMRNICFGRRSSKNNVRKNLQDFNGFEFERDSEEYQRHLSSLIKLKKDQLQSISDILGVPAEGRNEEQAEKILSFLMEPIDEGKTIPERKLSMRSSKQSSTNSKESLHTDEEENEIEEKTENGDDDELFEYDEEEDEEKEKDTDDDYIGSDDESIVNNKDDDPDDFAYQPGKKVSKKRPPVRRSRSRTTPKRKRVASRTTARRGRKKAKVIVDEKVENEDLPVASPTPMQINDEDIKKTEADVVETKNDDLNNIDTTLPEQTDNTSADIIPATS